MLGFSFEPVFDVVKSGRQLALQVWSLGEKSGPGQRSGCWPSRCGSSHCGKPRVSPQTVLCREKRRVDQNSGVHQSPRVQPERGITLNMSPGVPVGGSHSTGPTYGACFLREEGRRSRAQALGQPALECGLWGSCPTLG